MYMVAGVVAIVVIAGILLAYSGNIFGYGTQKQTSTESQQTIPTVREPSLSVNSQVLSGSDVVVDGLYLDEPGFVVIHKDANGAPGAVIGHSDLISGEKTNLKVAIDSSQAGSKVFAMLHYDDNSNGVYEFPQEDKPVKLADNVVVKPIVINQQTTGATEVTAVVTSEPKTVEITSTGFSPSSLTIKAGDTVTFANKDSSLHWPASAVHPTHSVYSESGGCIGSKFDACKGLAQGESWSFAFNQKGTWGYHDHLNPGLTGTIIVQ